MSVFPIVEQIQKELIEWGFPSHKVPMEMVKIRESELKKLSKPELMKICDGYGIHIKNPSYSDLWQEISLHENSKTKTTKFPTNDEICCSFVTSKLKKSTQIRCSKKAKNCASLFCHQHIKNHKIDITSQRYINQFLKNLWPFLPDKIIGITNHKKDFDQALPELYSYGESLSLILTNAIDIIIKKNLQIPKRQGSPSLFDLKTLYVSTSPSIMCWGVSDVMCYECKDSKPKIIYIIPWKRKPPIFEQKRITYNFTYDNAMRWSFEYQKSYMKTVCICEMCFIKLMIHCNVTRWNLLKSAIQYYLLVNLVINKIDDDCKKIVFSLIFYRKSIWQ